MTRFTMSQLVRMFAVLGIVCFGWTVAANAGLLTTDGDFAAQTIGATSTVAPWGGSGSGRLIAASAQSPFTNLFAQNGKGVSKDGANSPGYGGGTYQTVTTIPADATGSLYMNVDFRDTTNTGTGAWEIWLSTLSDRSKATTTLVVGASGMYAVSAGGAYGTSLLTPEVGVWYNVQLALNMDANTYSGTITREGTYAHTAISSRSFVSNNAITQMFEDALGPGGGVFTWPSTIPSHDLDNFALSNTPIPAPTPEPGTLALLATGILGLLAYAWRKRR